jgi:hypothetical protein
LTKLGQRWLDQLELSCGSDLLFGGEGGIKPTVRLPVQRFSSSKILMLVHAIL